MSQKEGEKTGQKKTDSVTLNRLFMAEKSAVQKSSSRSELQCLGKELTSAQRRREALRLTMVVTGDLYLAWNADWLPLM